MDTSTLKQILIEELQQYTGEGYNDYAYLTENEQAQLYAIVDIAMIRGKRLVGTVLIAQIVGEQIIIEKDVHDKMLVDALKARGVPPEQIILAYRGETVQA